MLSLATKCPFVVFCCLQSGGKVGDFVFVFPYFPLHRTDLSKNKGLNLFPPNKEVNKGKHVPWPISLLKFTEKIGCVNYYRLSAFALNIMALCVIILLFLFEPVMTVFKFLLSSWIVIYFYVGSIFEERRLIHEFGQSYKSYQQNVSRIIPFKWLLKILARTI